jgi:hypothetical protein
LFREEEPAASGTNAMAMGEKLRCVRRCREGGRMIERASGRERVY